ncbi:MAG: hypothetical protein KBC78_00330 [Candidatus Pacebacteria bacterium]|nr:hypothetical protein [Candidatus Paceibacterota bacterium]
MFVSSRLQSLSPYLFLLVATLVILFIPSSFAKAETVTSSVAPQSETLLKINELQKLVEKYQNMQLAITQPATTSSDTLFVAKLAGTAASHWSKDLITYTLYYDITAKGSDIYLHDQPEGYEYLTILNSKNEKGPGSYGYGETVTKAEKIVGAQGNTIYKVAKGTKQRFAVKVKYTPFISDDSYRVVLGMLPYMTELEGRTNTKVVNFSTYPVMWRTSGY